MRCVASARRVRECGASNGRLRRRDGTISLRTKGTAGMQRALEAWACRHLTATALWIRTASDYRAACGYEQTRAQAVMSLLWYALVLGAQNSVGRMRVGPWLCVAISCGALAVSRHALLGAHEARDPCVRQVLAWCAVALACWPDAAGKQGASGVVRGKKRGGKCGSIERLICLFFLRGLSCEVCYFEKSL